MGTEEKVMALFEKWAHVENGEQLQTMNVNDLAALVAELAELVQEASCQSA